MSEFFLNASDTCDAPKCGARAYVRVIVKTGDIFFCSHHAHTYEEALKLAALMIYDETAQLEEVKQIDVSA